jgi:hypothetical protein
MCLLIQVIRLVTGCIMIVSAWLHLQNPMLFYIHVAQYKLLPTSLLPWFVLTIPWILLFAGMLILTRSGRPAGSIVGASLFLSFTAAQLYVIWKGLGIDCGCFGAALNEKIGLATVSLPACLFIGCVILAIYDRNTLSEIDCRQIPNMAGGEMCHK